MASIGQSRPLVAPNPNMRTPLFIFGVALALVAFLVMFAFGVVFVGRQQVAGQVMVVVAKSQIEAREAITPDQLALSPLPANAVPSNTFLHVADLSGYAAVVQIYKGQPISANLVASNPDDLPIGTSQPVLPIPLGYVAFTLPTSELQGVAGYITQGDQIDVIAAVNTGQFSPVRPRIVVQTVFRSLRVIRVGPQTLLPKQGQAQGVVSSITVVMTRCDAEYMYWLLQSATLKYTLISLKEYGSPTPDSSAKCPSSTDPGRIGPAEVDARWHFTSV